MTDREHIERLAEFAGIQGEYIEIELDVDGKCVDGWFVIADSHDWDPLASLSDCSLLLDELERRGWRPVLQPTDDEYLLIAARDGRLVEGRGPTRQAAIVAAVEAVREE